jgi:hypothetical protein
MAKGKLLTSIGNRFFKKAPEAKYWGNEYRLANPMERLGGLEGAQKASVRLKIAKEQGKVVKGSSAGSVLAGRTVKQKISDAQRPTFNQGMGYRPGGRVRENVMELSTAKTLYPANQGRGKKTLESIDYFEKIGKSGKAEKDAYVKLYKSKRDPNVKGGSKYIDNVFGFDV